jgi:exodeoxyribonuclease VII small subunit
MSDDTYTFDSARVRLEEIAAEVRKKDTSLEKSLDLLEEGVRLANQCTELIDATQWRSTLDAAAAEGAVAREDSVELEGDLAAGDTVIVEEVTFEELPDGEVLEDVAVTESVVLDDQDAGDSAEASADDADSAWGDDPGHDDDERS